MPELSIDQVGVKLRFLAKRGEARKGRVETLKAEKKDLETQLKSTKVDPVLVVLATSNRTLFSWGGGATHWVYVAKKGLLFLGSFVESGRPLSVLFSGVPNFFLFGLAHIKTPEVLVSPNFLDWLGVH